ncbi:glycosyltransferase, partial [Chloroflexota bacterium]
MKICFIADARSVHTQKWVKYFANNGNDVHLISCKPLPRHYDYGGTKVHIIKPFGLQIG